MDRYGPQIIALTLSPTLAPSRSPHRLSASKIRFVMCGLFGVVAASSVLAQGQPSPALAPLQPKIPTQPNLPVAPKPLTNVGPAPDLVFVAQAMLDNLQRQPIIIKNIGNVASKPTSVGCSGGGDLPPPEKYFAIANWFHAVKALAPGETYEYLQPNATAVLSNYQCSIRPAEGERDTTNNSFRWTSGQRTRMDVATAPVQRASPALVTAKRPDIALQSITLAEANLTAADEVKVSFRANTTNVGNADVIGARVRCGVTPSTLDLGPSYVGSPFSDQAMVPHGGVSAPSDTHVIAFSLMMPFSANRELKRKPLKIICAMSFQSPADDINTANNRATSTVQFPDDGALNFPLLPR
ncbi:MAG: hypothetical protein EAZ43_12190 [Betaproteobacteria bacterium]|nr:MAG: hypothetical protein EAZ43_12190 [Betaproteobacteria bacterium]